MSRYDDMVKHLLGQFGKAEVIKAIFYALFLEFEELDKGLDDLKNKRWIDTGEGAQLDGIGQIVDMDRTVTGLRLLKFFGFRGQRNVTGFNQAPFRGYHEEYLTSLILNDKQYRQILHAKVWKNNTYAYTNDTVKSLQIIFGTNTIIVQNVGNAKIRISIGKLTSEDEKILIEGIDLLVRAAGVGYEFYNEFDKYAFGFKGQTYCKGFGQAPFSHFF